MHTVEKGSLIFQRDVSDQAGTQFENRKWDKVLLLTNKTGATVYFVI